MAMLFHYDAIEFILFVKNKIHESVSSCFNSSINSNRVKYQIN